MSLIGKPAPHFAGDASFGGETVEVSLADYAGKWLVLFFYPLDFTFVCPTELVAFSDAAAQFKAAGAELLACSVDSVHTHLAWNRTSRADAGVGELSYPLLSDLDKSICADYDVLSGPVALRGLYIIDPDGIVQHATVNNLAVGRNVSEVLRTLKAFQHVRENGDTCPANWHEGDSGMPATLDGVRDTIS